MKPFIVSVIRRCSNVKKRCSRTRALLSPAATHCHSRAYIPRHNCKVKGSKCFGSQEIMMQLSKDDYDPGWFLGINGSLKQRSALCTAESH